MQKRLLAALELLTTQTEEDCPGIYRSRQLNNALLDAHELIEEIRTPEISTTHAASLMGDEEHAELDCGCALTMTHPDGTTNCPTLMSCPLHTHAEELEAEAREILKSWREGSLLGLNAGLERLTDVLAVIDA